VAPQREFSDMSYVQRILQPGEEIRYVATIHWITYLPGLLILILAAVMWGFAESGNQPHKVVLAASAVVAAIAIILILRAWFHRWITEIAVTNRRVIYKTGFISRKTIEMHMDKVESVEVNQSIFGRLFDYGDITLVGTGDSHFSDIKTIANPIELRNQITGT
jgi:uncharacterized membrane protein YdbT with pleckstrin-like domain